VQFVAFYFQFQERNVLIVAGRQEEKTTFTWGTAAEPGDLRNAEE